jgi:hypothetical protein
MTVTLEEKPVSESLYCKLHSDELLPCIICKQALIDAAYGDDEPTVTIKPRAFKSAAHKRVYEAALPMLFVQAEKVSPAAITMKDVVEVLEVTDSESPDMPENAITGETLAYIYNEYMGNFPRAYAWPALLTVAGVLVPTASGSGLDLSPEAATVGTAMQTNLYTTLIGGVGTGKSQAIEHARGNLGLPSNRYTDTKAGSIEGLLNKIATDPFLARSGQVMVDLDEWSHFFKKAGIENASFVDILNSGYNKANFHLTIAGGKKIDLQCAISMIGGMVTDKVQECFNGASTGGFHDRFLFGVCPTNNPYTFSGLFEKRDSAQTDPQLMAVKPVPVKINKDVWKLAADWKKADLTLGRSVEVTVRCCSIIASFDGRSEITASDLEAMRPFLDYQQRCRKLIVPSSGVTTDAKMANAILGWLKRHADGGEWVTQRDLKMGVRRQLEELGPMAFKNTLASLQFVNAIEVNARLNSGARASDVVRLKKGF